MRIVLALLLTALAQADTYPRQPGLDALHYVFRLTLSDTTDEIEGQATVDLRFLEANLTEVSLDLAGSMAVTAVTSANQPLAFTHAGDQLRIRLAAPPAGSRRQFTIVYHGVPASGLRIGPNSYGQRTFFSENWPNRARQWLPMIDHPSDKATSEFLITAPAHYQVIANGLLQEERDLSGTRLTHWKQSTPISSWLNAIGVARFSVRHLGSVKGIELSTWVYPQDREKGIVAFDEPARQAIEFFSEAIGPFAYEKLANVVAAGVSGGTEHASAIFYGEKSLTGKPATRLVYHEIAHQWFGNAVTEKDWDDVWLSEGFATYFTLLATEHYEGRDAFLAGLKRSREGIFALEARLPDTPVIHLHLDDMKKVLNRLIYEKGGWTLHMLRGLIGTENFWAGIRTYYRRYRDQNASTADFRRVMEETSGQQLGWFFDQWLKRPGVPAVAGTWHYDATAKRVHVELSQTQAGEAYVLPLELQIGDALVSARLTAKAQSFEFPADSRPVQVTLDPHTSILMKATWAAR